MSGARPERIVIVGASLAGLRAAEELRARGFAGTLTIVGDEPYRPYDRPPLSKHVLSGDIAATDTALPATSRLSADWRLGQPAVALDRAAREVTLADGATIPFDRLLIATGAQARGWPDADDARLAGVFTLRRRDDAAALRAALANKPRGVLIVGAGLIGCEAASCCRSLGIPVTLVDPNPTPLARALGSSVGRIIADRLKEEGVAFQAETRVSSLEGDGADRISAALLDNGRMVKTDVVIAALGATRETGWLAEAGLKADVGGVTCDAACRVLDADGAPCPEIYAAGDVARWPNALYGGRLISVEHWGNAVDQARHAACNMLAGPDGQRDYRHLPAFWSSQFGLNIKSVGLVDGADEVAFVQGSRASRRFLAVYGRNGRTIAAVSFDQARWLPAYAERIEAGAPFPPILRAGDQPKIEIMPAGLPDPREASARRIKEAAHV